MSGPTRRDIERRIERLADTEREIAATITLALGPEHLEELADLAPGDDMSHDLAAAIREAEMAARFD